NINIYNDKISGSIKDGNYSSTVKVGGSALPGTYAISSLQIEDSIGNRVHKYGADLDKYLVSIGIDKASLTFEVIGTTPVTSDSAEPKLVSVKLESVPKFDISSIPQIVAGSTITIELDFNDISGIGIQQNLEGVDSPEDNAGFIFIANPNGPPMGGMQNYYSFTRADIIKGTDKNGTLRKIIKLNDNAALGQWYIQSLGIYDKSGNSINTGFGNTPGANEIAKFAAKLRVTPESTSFNVINNSPNSIIDNEPP
ncbi:hypothetical protein, partial [Synechococcus sp. UW140]|uniref:hypothetical protein n=1 Tax=Synechococcus sp. UW140 TaxID=368503 RepID=UPI0031382C6A